MEMKKNSRLVAIVVTLMMIVTQAYCAAIDGVDLPDAPKTEAQMYFDQIPLEKRETFIRYYLAKGLEEQGLYVVRAARISSKEIMQEFGTAPEGFTKNLLNWTKDMFEMDDEHVQQLVLDSKVCLPSKGCYDPGDIGEGCCPF